MTDDNKAQLARDWYAVKDKLTELQEQERAMREQLVQSYFGESLDSGTHKHRLSDKAEIVVTIPKKITLDMSIFNSHKAELSQKGLIGDDRLVKVKYEVSATALKHLSEPDKLKYGDMFVYSTGTAQVKIDVKKD